MGELRVSCRTTNEKLAKRYDDLVVELRDLGRFEPLLALKRKQVTLHDLHTNRNAAALNALLERRSSPLLLPLLNEWLDTPEAIARVRATSMRRYRTSWKHITDAGLVTASTRLSAIDQDFVAAFKRSRASQTISKATLNRDLAAIGSFLSWCTDEKGLMVVRPKLKYQQEAAGRMRWLTREEIERFRAHCDEEWWSFFGLLMSTGIAVGEARGLRVDDVSLTERRISVHEAEGRTLKRKSRRREVVFPESQLDAMRGVLTRASSREDGLLFPFSYSTARKVWIRVCKKASIKSARIHDARHTYAVHAVSNGIPEARLQKLLGHAHAGTTRRYAAHAPEQFVESDAERIARGMGLSELAA